MVGGTQSGVGQSRSLALGVVRGKSRENVWHGRVQARIGVVREGSGL